MTSPPSSNEADSLLRGAIDLHLHFGPDAHLQRSVDALEAAEQAASAGMAAIVLKSHDYPTAALATIVDKAVEGIRVFGGLCLDRQIGGLNPSAVEVALRLGTKIIWLPTLSSANDHAKLGFPGPGISILDDAGRLRPEMHEIFALAKQHDIVLASGHVSVPEIDAFLTGARAAGVEKLLITHALETLAGPTLTIDDLHRFVRAGAAIEFSYLTCGGALATEPPEKIAAAIRSVGAARCVMSTDYGQKKNVPPVEGMRLFIRDMLRCGIAQADVETMVRANPRNLLALATR
jgi:Family of unknown function (DUF6282)